MDEDAGSKTNRTLNAIKIVLNNKFRENVEAIQLLNLENQTLSDVIVIINDYMDPENDET